MSALLGWFFAGAATGSGLLLVALRWRRSL